MKILILVIGDVPPGTSKTLYDKPILRIFMQKLTWSCITIKLFDFASMSGGVVN